MRDWNSRKPDDHAGCEFLKDKKKAQVWNNWTWWTMSSDLGTIRSRNSRSETIKSTPNLGNVYTLVVIRNHMLHVFIRLWSDIPGHCRAGLETSSHHREQDTAGASGAGHGQASDTGSIRTNIYTTTLNEVSFSSTYTPSPQVVVETQNSMQSPTSKQIATAMGSCRTFGHFLSQIPSNVPLVTEEDLANSPVIPTLPCYLREVSTDILTCKFSARGYYFGSSEGEGMIRELED